MSYVDGYILAVPRKNLQAYRKMAQQGRKVWKKHGALEYFECVGDDLKSKWSSIKFPKTVRAKPNEVVIFSFIVFKSKSHRNKVNAKVMKEMSAESHENEKMPFDMKRMVYGGFKTIVRA